MAITAQRCRLIAARPPGVVLSASGGVVAALTRDLGPLWYPVALLAVMPPAAWLGGALRERETR